MWTDKMSPIRFHVIQRAQQLLCAVARFFLQTQELSTNRLSPQKEFSPHATLSCYFRGGFTRLWAALHMECHLDTQSHAAHVVLAAVFTRSDVYTALNAKSSASWSVTL
jgi:hypothetical protein